MFLGMHPGLIALIDFADLSLGMVMLHLFTFDPAWIPGRTAERHETLFYDGTCGLCHRTVRLVLAEDTRAALRFAPLESDALAERLSPEERAALPDSFLVFTASGELLDRSSAATHVMIGLGGLWRILGTAIRILPRAVRDAVYDLIAAYRKRAFAQPKTACPMLPPHLGERFLA
ncbi:MAG: DUF393 domain-containing protein [bacterium]|nr:DUF393 domain-containing protein [bacterium]